MGPRRIGNKPKNERVIGFVAEVDRDPICAAGTELNSRIGFELGAAFTDDPPSQSHLDHAGTLEVCDFFAVDPEGVAMAEHRFGNDDSIYRGETMLKHPQAGYVR